ncbi:hypothetical protein J6590_021211 [Homalodisca vitripennis]|nr:hypothetical protein J6590_021211 [Homalodisca vitripennis]
MRHHKSFPRSLCLLSIHDNLTSAEPPGQESRGMRPVCRRRRQDKKRCRYYFCEEVRLVAYRFY